MNHPARIPLREIERPGKKDFDFVDFTLKPLPADLDDRPRCWNAKGDFDRDRIVQWTEQK
jgi:hypothetical protein